MIKDYLLGIILLSIQVLFYFHTSFAFQQPDQSKSEEVYYIRNIIFRGNHAINNKTLNTMLDIRPGQKFDPDSVNNTLSKILAEYKKIGYIFAKASWEIELIEKNQVIINISFDEGEIIKISDITLLGETIFPKEYLLARLDLRKNQYFDDVIFQNDIKKLLDLYSEIGYPLVTISPEEFIIEENKLNIKINIEPGPLVRIGQIQIVGLKKTKDKILLREFRIHSGDIFDQRKIDETEWKLNNTGYFQRISNTTFSQPEDNTINLNWVVNEGRTGQFSGILGYDPSESNQGSKRFAGVLEAVENNLFGTGRKISIKARFGSVNIYEFMYKEPWFLEKPLDIEIQFRGSNRDDVLSMQNLKEQEGGFGGTVRMFGLVNGSLMILYKKIKSSQIKSPENLTIKPDNLSNGQKYSLVLTIQRDSRDYFSNPSKGRLDRISMEIARGDFKIHKTWIDLNQYFKIFNQQVFYIGIHGARVFGENVPLTELLYLGGANSLRGYIEDQFRGEGKYLANLEYRFLAGRDSQFFIFLDDGSIYSKKEGFGSLKTGYGFGMRIQSQNGLVSLDYGLAKGESFIKGKIHISLGATF